jgi:signal transduction histidine kinase
MELDVAPGPVRVGIDEGELAAAVDALLGNVFAHTPDGSPFAVRLHAGRSGGAVLVVEDSGPGLGDADAARRGVSGAGSTGLGLDIVRQAAARSGGSLDVAASPAGGAKLTVTFGPLSTVDSTVR